MIWGDTEKDIAIDWFTAKPIATSIAHISTASCNIRYHDYMYLQIIKLISAEMHWNDDRGPKVKKYFWKLHVIKPTILKNLKPIYDVRKKYMYRFQ